MRTCANMDEAFHVDPQHLVRHWQAPAQEVARDVLVHLRRGDDSRRRCARLHHHLRGMNQVVVTRDCSTSRARFKAAELCAPREDYQAMTSLMAG